MDYEENKGVMDRVATEQSKKNLARFEFLYSERNVIEATWEKIEQYISPYRGKFYQQDITEDQVEWRKQRIYDSTALMAAQILSSNMHGNLTNPSMRWFDMQFNNEQLRDDNAASKWLETASNETYQAIQSSNFNLEVSELYTDLVAFGTGAMVEEASTDYNDNFDGLAFTSVPIKELYFEDNWKSQPQRFYRLLSWPASKAISKFGRDNCPRTICEAYDRGDTTLHEIVFCIWRRDGIKENPFKKVPPEQRPYGYCYYMRQGAIPLMESEGGYYEMPSFIAKWRKSSGSRWGNSPAMVALPDVLTLNELVKLVLRANNKVVDPTTFVEERALIGDLDLSPGGLNVIRRVDAIQQFESKARFDVSAMKIEDLREAINRYFYLDQLQLKESPTMTATEVQVRYEMMQRTLGPTLGRLQVDFLNPLVERSFNILVREGRLPDPPANVVDLGGEATINYLGPLARSQRVDASAAIERYISQLIGFMQLDPAIRNVPDLTEMAIFAAQNLNVPAKLIKPRREIKADIDKEKQQQQAMMEAQANEQNARANELEAKAEGQRANS